MTGLPASGKTTLGRSLAKILNFQFLDKDVILESLLSQHKIFSLDLRQQLSRESDSVFQEEAFRLQNVVLTSFWRSRDDKSASGTPSDWLPLLSDNVIEIQCHCDVETAVDRFLTRKRHPGHMDHVRDKSALRTQFENLSAKWPVRLGQLLEVNTSQPVNTDELVLRIKMLWPDLHSVQTES
jgi:cytidylate kinase